MPTNTTMNIPIFETGKTPEELMQKILARSRKTGKEYKVITIYFDGKKHVAWFYETFKTGAMI